MAKDKTRKKKEQPEEEEIEETIDPYTGELEPVAEDADQFIEVVPEETDDRKGQNYLLNEESGMDSYAADADADAVAEQSAHYTDDEDIKTDFAERQDLGVGGRDELQEDLDEHHSLSPDLSGGDLDASWQTANGAGEETVGGSAPTPDQDVVDDLGAAAGLTYADEEPLNSDKKLLDRDRHRWELNPASTDDQEEEGLESLEELEDEELDELEDELDELEEESELDDDEDDEELDELDELDEDEGDDHL
ncbi:MAG TPA: DUF6335 family protein [Anaerolineales bacterium]|nr:DUF6335 family protein [Anaerolineales bacterium]